MKQQLVYFKFPFFFWLIYSICVFSLDQKSLVWLRCSWFNIDLLAYSSFVYPLG